MHEAAEQAVIRLGIEILGDQDGYDEGVDCDNTRHDDGNEALETDLSASAGALRKSNGPVLDEMLCSIVGRWKKLTDLHDQIWPESADTCDAYARFGRTVGRSRAAEDHGRCDTALFEEVSKSVRRGSCQQSGVCIR